MLKAFFGQFRLNSADTLADQENPVGRAQLRYVFNDLNGNRLLDGPQELGRLVQTDGGGGFVRVDPEIDPPDSQRDLDQPRARNRQGLSGRASYVYKNIRDNWGESRHRARGTYTVPFTINDIGADGVAGTGDDNVVQLLDRPGQRAVRPRLHQQLRPGQRSTSTPWSSRSTAACAASGCCSPRSATPG